MSVIVKPAKVLRLRPVNRALLVVAALGLAATAAALLFVSSNDGRGSLLAAPLALLVLLAGLLVTPAWRQRVEVDDDTITVTPGYGARRRIERRAVVNAVVDLSNPYDLVGWRYLRLWPGAPALSPPLTIVLDLYSPADQDYLLRLARDLTGNRLQTRARH